MTARLRPPSRLTLMLRSSGPGREPVGPGVAAYGTASSTRGFTPGPTPDETLTTQHNRRHHPFSPHRRSPSARCRPTSGTGESSPSPKRRPARWAERASVLPPMGATSSLSDGRKAHEARRWAGPWSVHPHMLQGRPGRHLPPVISIRRGLAPSALGASTLSTPSPTSPRQGVVSPGRAREEVPVPELRNDQDMIVRLVGRHVLWLRPASGRRLHLLHAGPGTSSATMPGCGQGARPGLSPVPALPHMASPRHRRRHGRRATRLTCPAPGPTAVAHRIVCFSGPRVGALPAWCADGVGVGRRRGVRSRRRRAGTGVAPVPPRLRTPGKCPSR